MKCHFCFILLFFCLGCGSPPEIKQVSITLQQGLTSFDTEDILSLWVFETNESNCEFLEANSANTSENDSGFVTSDVQNAQALEQAGGATFELTELPPDKPLAFLAKISDGASQVLTQGCNDKTEAIGKGNLLTLKIILDPLP